MEKVQYALIYYFYKTRQFKSGRGYIWRANQFISIVVSSIFCLLVIIGSNWSLSRLSIFLSFLFPAGIVFFILEANVKRHKLFWHRRTYLNRKRYLIRFLFISLSILFALIAIYYLGKPEKIIDRVIDPELANHRECQSLSDAALLVVQS